MFTLGVVVDLRMNLKSLYASVLQTLGVSGATTLMSGLSLRVMVAFCELVPGQDASPAVAVRVTS